MGSLKIYLTWGGGGEEEEESNKAKANGEKQRDEKKSRPSLEQLAQRVHGKNELERGKNILEPYVCWVTCVDTGSATGGTDRGFGTAGILDFEKRELLICIFQYTKYNLFNSSLN